MANILLITADQWRGEALGSLGHRNASTPNLDRLARAGVTFRRHFAQAAPCSPARACLYTGLYQMTNRVCRNGTPLDARHDNLALALRRQGYEPTLFGYTDQAADPRGLPANDPALTTYEGVLPGFSVRRQLPEDERAWLSWLRQRGVAVPVDGSPGIHEPASGPADPPRGAVPTYGADDTQTAFLTDEFIRWLGEQPAGRPWCAHLSFLRPHPPFVVPEPYASMVAPADVPAPAGFGDPDATAARHPLLAYLIGSVPKAFFMAGASGLVRDWSEADVRQIRATYFGMIAEVDVQLGRIWSALDAAGAWDDTLIVFTSDHGEMLGDHHLFGKGGPFDASYHIPLIIRDPSAPRAFGNTVDAFTESVDLFPTIVARTGGAVPAHLDGCSLAPFLDGDRPGAWRAAAHFEFDFREVATGTAQQALGLDLDACNMAAIRGDRFKYVHFAGLPPLLFDLVDDPGETRDLAGDPDYRDLRLDMAEELLSWRARHLDRALSGLELTPRGVVDARA